MGDKGTDEEQGKFPLARLNSHLFDHWFDGYFLMGQNQKNPGNSVFQQEAFIS